MLWLLFGYNDFFCELIADHITNLTRQVSGKVFTLFTHCENACFSLHVNLIACAENGLHMLRNPCILGCTTGERLAAEYRSETEMGRDASELLLHLAAVNGASHLARCIHTGRWMILLRCN